MNLTLWIIAGLLAVVFVVEGVSKLTMPKRSWLRPPAGDGSKTSAPAPSRPSEPSRSWLRLAWSCPLRWTSRRFWFRWLLSVWCC